MSTDNNNTEPPEDEPVLWYVPPTEPPTFTWGDSAEVIRGNTIAPNPSPVYFSPEEQPDEAPTDAAAPNRMGDRPTRLSIEERNALVGTEIAKYAIRVSTNDIYAARDEDDTPLAVADMVSYFNCNWKVIEYREDSNEYILEREERVPRNHSQYFINRHQFFDSYYHADHYEDHGYSDNHQDYIEVYQNHLMRSFQLNSNGCNKNEHYISVEDKLYKFHQVGFRGGDTRYLLRRVDEEVTDGTVHNFETSDRTDAYNTPPPPPQTYATPSHQSFADWISERYSVEQIAALTSGQILHLRTNYNQTTYLDHHTQVVQATGDLPVVFQDTGDGDEAIPPMSEIMTSTIDVLIDSMNESSKSEQLLGDLYDNRETLGRQVVCLLESRNLVSMENREKHVTIISNHIAKREIRRLHGKLNKEKEVF